MARRCTASRAEAKAIAAKRRLLLVDRFQDHLQAYLDRLRDPAPANDDLRSKFEARFRG